MILNACHSKSIAAEIVKSCNGVIAIGMAEEIMDHNAILFAKSLFTLLFNGLPIREACYVSQILLKGERDIPEVIGLEQNLEVPFIHLSTCIYFSHSNLVDAMIPIERKNAGIIGYLADDSGAREWTNIRFDLLVCHCNLLEEHLIIQRVQEI